MDRETLFEIWAPASAVWSAWAKPVLFAQANIYRDVAEPLLTTFDTEWASAPNDLSAIIVELPGAESVALGLALARRGYRPVPLFNSCNGPRPAVPVEPILLALRASATDLAAQSIPHDAPPAFLLDGNRMKSAVPLSPGVFDNRSVVFPQDFPSANALGRMGIRSAIVLRRGDQTIQDDLRHVLRRWQEAGITILTKNCDDARQPTTVNVPRPSQYRSLLYRVLTLLRLRRNSAGGFGSIIPDASSGGGFG